MAAQQKIKVKVADLIAEVEKRHAERVSAYEEALKRYEKEDAVFRREMVAFCERLLTKAQRDPHSISFSTYRGDLENVPHAPGKPVKPAPVDVVVTQLKMAADETITISAADFAAWIG